MGGSHFAIFQWLTHVQMELLLFAATFFAIGLIDEFFVDVAYVWFRLTGRIRTEVVDEDLLREHRLAGPAVLFIPAWKEQAVVGTTIAHVLGAWPQPQLRIFIGCYPNDHDTIQAVENVLDPDERVRVVIVDRPGPTTKAHCLNQLYAALLDEEKASGTKAHMVILHDAEDMVDPAGLAVMDRAIRKFAFVQLPVMALPSSSAPMISGHYSDEFAESHAKIMPVRDAIGSSVPGAGVGSAVSREALAKLAELGSGKVFAEDALTEDYELGQRITQLGGVSRFLRLRTDSGRLIATRAYFPETWETSVRQKARWTHGICLQSWDRLGWSGNLAQRWMTLRDRRGPFAAVLLACAYTLVLFGLASTAATYLGLVPGVPLSDTTEFLIVLTALGFGWRLVLRAIFTGREYGVKQALLSVPRAFVSNFIAIASASRAARAYFRTLRGEKVVWDKTEHSHHPALAMQQGATR